MASRDIATDRQLRVLVVDDSDEFRSAACAYLRSTPGVNVVAEAGDGEDAITKADALRPDLVLMDVRMAPCSGLDAARRIKELLPRPEVVLFSLHADEYLRRAALAAGATELFSKSDFVQRVGETLARMVHSEAERNQETPMLPPPNFATNLHENQEQEWDWTDRCPAHPSDVPGPGTVLEHRLRRAQRVEALASLAGDLAHGFNNVLQAIIANTALAQRVLGPDERASTNLREIQAAGERAATLMKELLAFGWQESQPLRELDLASLVREALRQVRASVPAEIEITASFGERLPCALVHPSQIHQLVVILCSNAANALQELTGDHDKHIDVRLELCDPSGEEGCALPNTLFDVPCLRLTVSDNGVGMDAATRARMFEPFFSSRASGRGAGLGLCLARGIVTAHEGAIIVESKPDAGTTCRAYLPIAPTAQPSPTALLV